ncbi:hypothetical protein SHTP_0193 [Mycobacterium ulcerans subsp. shinshuense]|uniref:Uncharacterized protein n=1 Tax=Mycobacterium ulcerans subsp. shinshuense TaxID=1124626 RepID=A0A1B4XXR1_MYCUL|nr:hypothetical protein MMSP_0469 [Mycobacterium sp. 012931]MBC9864804.1 hypothetical protein [Mycobacterium pseudoshottsii]ULL12464.1 hypothetical protein CKW46_01175 [Mycobacterium liflandii]BAV39592.1 hypothetical protein SHTP_0193 [Mycobacterium ulcerans subsp. shinshuense]
MIRNPVVSVSVGATAIALGWGQSLFRNVQRLPLVGSWVRQGIDELSQRGDRWLAQNVDPLRARVLPMAGDLVDLVLDQIDLTALVRERLDLDALVAEVDIDAVINRIDLITLADKVIDGVDLPGIIRESTSSVTAEVMTDVRSQGERADDRVARIVDRVLGRDRDDQ